MSGNADGSEHAGGSRGDFVWGVSTSAFQIEGAVTAGGRGESIWDRFAARPGNISDGSTGAVACDHYHRWEEDLDLLAALGVGAYRFSLAWPRLQPSGRGRLAAAGLDFYDRLLDGLKQRGIEPWVCLYHWDLPQALQERVGGWTGRDCAHYFADYAGSLADLLAGRCEHVLLLNEPNVHAVMGHLLGLHAPGLSDLGDFFAALHHQNLATALAAEQLRQELPAAALGTVLNLQPVRPADEGEEHQAAAALVDAVYNRGALDPLYRGAYPEALTGFLEPYLQADDQTRLAQPLDLLGLNHYTRLYVRAAPEAPAGLELAPPPAGREVTAMGWEVAPEAFVEQLTELRDDYGNPPVYVTENGAAFADEPDARGRVNDRARAAYLSDHVRALLAAREEGCDVRGYFAWTLVDNFEWAEGFSKRFGLVHLDRESQLRTPKRSFDAYREIISANGAL